uniref:Carboxylic ester hydrolase n=1 Tax=Ovatospora brasiliensis TaxID=1934393 RepID=A0A8K1DZI0_9PEZI|nr:hypothetical protein [Ovatospora brasiliensis]
MALQLDSITVSPSLCTASTFPYPSVFGVEFVAIQANLVTNYSTYVSDLYYNHNPELWVENATFCNVTLTYTHPGVNDHVIVESWLPIPWNGRFQAIGGGGWTGGRTMQAYQSLAGAMGSGCPGNVNWQYLDNLGSKSLNEQAIIGKYLVNRFYSQPPKYSYFNGCSQGGRQGVQLAQRYPEHYDGIAAAAPGMYWSQFFQAMVWPQVVMNELGEYPYPCELDYLQQRVIQKCDAEDGLVDGIILDPHNCRFNPHQHVGDSFQCHNTNTTMRLSRTAATVAQLFHDGARDEKGRFLWYGPHWGANLTTTIFGTPGMAATNCTSGKCESLPFPYGIFWTGLFGVKDPQFDLSKMTRAEYARVFRLSAHEYASMYGSDNPDLTLFQESGAKMITYHGLLDDICPTRGTEQYYNEVRRLHSNASSFYRYYEVPGVGHCAGGPGGIPTHVFESLRNWVENGKAPGPIPIDVPRLPPSQTRVLCPYPQKIRVDRRNNTRFYCSN